MKVKKVLVRSLLVITIVVAAILIYTVWDNSRIKVVRQEVRIPGLPKDLEGYNILQLTDLQGRTFGSNQDKLIRQINSLNYDSILFTGDILDDKKFDYAPFYHLLDGIENKTNAMYVQGNSDPSNYKIDGNGELTKHEFVNGMEKRGVKLLESSYELTVDGATLTFVDFELSILDPEKGFTFANGRTRPQMWRNKQYIAYQNELLQQWKGFEKRENEVLIAVNHFPIIDERIDQLTSSTYYKFRNYDLIIAGHYHGGQIRIPFLGALIVPEAFYDFGGLFPPQDRVKGLWEYKGVKQYVSAGLGSSDAVGFMNFRLFNTPEINLLTLKGTK